MNEVLSKPATEGGIMPRSMLENLQSTKLRLESELSRVNDALEALQNNPEVAQVLEKVLKVANRF
jgi:hypothetical protein